MKSIAKLKDRARKLEQQEEWAAAIEAYKTVLEREEAEDEFETDLGLANRIGDLYLRLGQGDEAVDYYVTAADKYASAGFYNNAIALCNKALRHRPNQSELYLKLSDLCAKQGFQTDARRWILEYADREMRSGRVEPAFTALAEFADMSGDPEVRETLADHLAGHEHPEDALTQLQLAYELRVRRGETEAAESVAEKARAIDPAAELGSAALEGAAADEPEGDILDWEHPRLREVKARADHTDADAASVGGLETFETTAEEVDAGPETDVLDGLETSPGDVVAASETEEELVAGDVPADDRSAQETEAGEEPEPDAGVEEPVSEAGPEPSPSPSSGEEERAPAAKVAPERELPEELEPLPLLAEPEVGEEAKPLPLLDFGFDGEDEGAGDEESGLDMGSGTVEAGSGQDSLEFRVEGAVPDRDDRREGRDRDIAAILEQSRDLVGRDLPHEALRELNLLPTDTADRSTIERAVMIVNEIIRRDENDVPALQRRVDYAFRLDDVELQVSAVRDLADALARLGAETKAQDLYARILELDPGQDEVRKALDELRYGEGAIGLARAGASARAEEEGAGEPAAEAAAEEPAAEGAAEEPAAETAEASEPAAEATVTEQSVEESAEGAVEEPVVGVRSADPDPEFAAMLTEFRAKVTGEPEADDVGDHYDLGLAFKEMGLLDEAIAEFRTELARVEVPRDRLRIYEELGQCHMQKGHYTVAITVLERALAVPDVEASELLGIYYHLGHCYSELGQRDDARGAYARILAIDESFADVPDRMAQL